METLIGPKKESMRQNSYKIIELLCKDNPEWKYRIEDLIEKYYSKNRQIIQQDDQNGVQIQVHEEVGIAFPKQPYNGQSEFIMQMSRAIL